MFLIQHLESKMAGSLLAIIMPPAKVCHILKMDLMSGHMLQEEVKETRRSLRAESK